jgi:hypothetical protein
VKKVGEIMVYIGPIAIMMLVLSPFLIPLMITAWHAAGGSSRRVERSREAARRRLDGVPTKSD